jgi:hypothetical protein
MTDRHRDVDFLADPSTVRAISGAGAPELDPTTGAPARSRSGDVPFNPVGRRTSRWSDDVTPGFATEPRTTLEQEEAIRERYSIRHKHNRRGGVTGPEMEHDRDPANAHRMLKADRIELVSPGGSQVVEVTEQQAAPWHRKGWRRV